MTRPLLTAKDAAEALGIGVTTFYEWLAQSDQGTFEIRGKHMSIAYFQGGRKGQGRIQIEPAEVERIKEFMRVHPKQVLPRKPPIRRASFPGITVQLGRPDTAD